MPKQICLYIDQYNNEIWASSIRELVKNAGGGRVYKIRNKDTVHIGYIVGKKRFIRYTPYREFAQGIMKAV